MYRKNEILTFSNLLSLLRLFLAIPFWIYIRKIEEPGVRTLLITLAIVGAISDWADGFLARKRNEVTEVGKIIDPLADKIAIGAIIISFYIMGAIPEYYFFLIVGRDALIFMGGIYVTKKIGRVLPSNMLGKIAVSSIGIVILLVMFNVNHYTILFQFFFDISIILVFISLFAYLYRAVEYIRKENK